MNSLFSLPIQRKRNILESFVNFFFISIFGGLGTRAKQEPILSSSEPNPVEGGSAVILAGGGCLSTLITLVEMSIS